VGRKTPFANPLEKAILRQEGKTRIFGGQDERGAGGESIPNKKKKKKESN